MKYALLYLNSIPQKSFQVMEG